MLVKLQPFVYYCQFVGLIPFVMETDEFPMKKFRKFSFSLRYPVTWWFFFLCISQLIVSIWDVRTVWHVFYEDDLLRSHIPSVLAVFVIQEHIFLIILLGICRYVISKYVCIRRAISFLQKVNNDLMVDDMSPEDIPSVTRPAIIGMISSVVSVSYSGQIEPSMNNLLGFTFRFTGDRCVGRE